MRQACRPVLHGRFHTVLPSPVSIARLAVNCRQQLSSMPSNADGVCTELWTMIANVYATALESGAAIKTDTKVEVFQDAGVGFVLRVASVLKSKPKGLSGSQPSGQQNQQPRQQQQQQQLLQEQQQQQPAPPFHNPFLPFEEDLWIQHLSDTHTLLLNKFNVAPHHVLVVTRKFESQQDPLNTADLAATQQVLAAMPAGGVAFYNCGQHSGRSQPHKHIQVVPLPWHSKGDQQQQQDTKPADPPIQQLIDEAQQAAGARTLQPFAVQSLPFRAYAVTLEPSSSPEQLNAAAQQLLKRCQLGLPEPVSYNVILTRSFMLMVPRRQEMCGNIAINSLGFAGTILLKSEEDLSIAKQQKPMHILAQVGQPWESEGQQPTNNTTKLWLDNEAPIMAGIRKDGDGPHSRQMG